MVGLSARAMRSGDDPPSNGPNKCWDEDREYHPALPEQDHLRGVEIVFNRPIPNRLAHPACWKCSTQQPHDRYSNAGGTNDQQLVVADLSDEIDTDGEESLTPIPKRRPANAMPLD
jgi:hypothetical protein